MLSISFLYFDIDPSLCLTAFESLTMELSITAKCWGCSSLATSESFILSNSFFGATPGNPILKRLLSSKRLNDIDFYNSAVDFETGPGYLRSGIRLSDNYLIFPTTYFYPFVEEYSPGEDPKYRKSAKNKCHSKKKTKKTKKIIIIPLFIKK